MACVDCKSEVPKGGVVTIKSRVLLEYVGPRNRSFDIIGGVTRARYHVPGPGALVEALGEPGVGAPDVGWFLSVGGGGHYQYYQEPEPEPEPEPEGDEEE